MKIILLLLTLLTFSMHGQCMDDIDRYGEYQRAEKFNYFTNKYECYDRLDSTETLIIVQPEKKRIIVRNEPGTFYEEYILIDCQMGNTRLVYWCKEIRRSYFCSFIFNSDKSCTVVYDGPEQTNYRLSKRKN